MIYDSYPGIQLLEPSLLSQRLLHGLRHRSKAHFRHCLNIQSDIIFKNILGCLERGHCAAAIRALRTEDTAPGDPVLGGISAATVGRRIAAAAKYAGVKGRIASHSGRIGLATELTRRGASLQEVMLAGNWSSARMVAHYCAGARAERGAVAKYL